MYEPLVSIIIPVYNGSNYMREAIDSALAQSYKNIEVIVINDGSNDDGATNEIARSYGNKIRYYEKKNGGVSSALNYGIKEMHGEYFSWLSHDDVYKVDKIKKQIDAINQHMLDKSVVIYCNSMAIDAYSNPIRSRRITSSFEPYKVYTAECVLTRLLKKSTFNGCGLLIPKHILVECGMFDEKLRFCQDAIMWYKIFMRDYSLFCIDDISVKTRVHPGQLTQKGQHIFRKECEVISGTIVMDFIKVSTYKNNFLKLYLISDACFLSFRRVKEIVSIGKNYRMLSLGTVIKAYLICGYGHIRPVIRKVYYALFRKIYTK